MTNTSAIPYDDPDLAVGGDYIKWEMVGQTVIGTIIGFRKQMRVKADGTQFANGVYTLREDDGTEIFLEVGQVYLKGLFKEKQPQLGDRIRIVFESEERLAGKPSPMKKFTLDVVKGNANAGPINVSAPATAVDPVVAHLESQLGATVIDNKPPF